jgi:anaerobic selenocysteine-containing dehydrogenase
MIRTFNTACPRNCYSTCSFKVRVEDSKILDIEAQPLNKATPEGPCLKGLSYKERAHSKDRILYPLKKSHGVFKRISWEEALEEISTKLTHYKQKYGSHSVFFYAASGMSGLLNSISSTFWKQFGGTTTVYGNLCWPAGLEATRLTLGENKHNVPWDMEHADLIVLWGKNPAESNIHQMLPIEKAQRNGAQLIVIDPRRTPSAERADVLVQPIPGTDGLLALAIAKLLIEKDWIDKAFIQKYVKGFEAFKESLETISIKKASEVCGVKIEFIEKLAYAMGHAKGMYMVPGYGMQRYTNGGQTTRCILSLSVLTGHIGKSGSCWHYANLQSYVFDDIKEPENYFPSEADHPFRRSIPTALFGEKMMAQNHPELKMAWVERGNPVAQNPDSNQTIKAFRQLDFVVVVEQFMTDTALEADIILPAKNMFEQSDIIGSYWNPYVQLRQKVLEPAGEVKPESEIYYLLAQKLGFDPEWIQKNIPEPNDSAVEAFLNKYLERFDDLSLKKLKEGPIIAPGTENIAFEDFKFKTPSGKIELFSEQAKALWGVSELPSYESLVEGQNNKDSHYPLSLMSPNTKNRIHSQFGNLDCIKILDPKPILWMSPKDAHARKLKEGEQVLVFNDRGEVKITLGFDYSLRPGNVVMVNGYWNSEGGSPNLLSKGRETDMGHGTAFHDNMVEVKKI